MTISRFIDIREDVKRVICNALDRMSAKSFIEENHRNPSKYRIEEHDMLNWVKANRKVMNAGKLKEDSK